MIRFAESNQCRMTSLVRHFGDTSDSAAACGLCDFCAPSKCVAQRFRTATEEERTALYRVLRGLQSISSKSTGKLYSELFPGNEISRDNFEEVLGAMARAELLTVTDAVFEKEGKQIPYRTCPSYSSRARRRSDHASALRDERGRAARFQAKTPEESR
jgi:superfamily II DNA helicase RecQ